MTTPKQPRPPTLEDRFRYAFDALMAKGAGALLAWHLLIALAVVFAISVAVVALGMTPTDEDGAPIGFAALLWTTLMHAIDPGTITGDENGPAWRAIMMTATVGGILLIGSLVAVLVASVANRFNALRQGHSRVLEQGHTLVLGWSRQIFTIVGELALANRSRKRGCIVVYAEHDKVWMEDELRAKVGDTGRTRVVVRSGDPTDPASLATVAPEHAQSILVLAPEGARDDNQVMRTLLAVGRSAAAPGRSQHLVTEIRDPRNVAVARLTGERRIEVLEIGDLVAKIAVQTCLQSGLSVVYEELLGFEGNEIYFVDVDTDAAALIGQRFGDALHQLEDRTLIGLRDVEGRVQLRPSMDRTIAAGEQLISIADDDDGCVVTPWKGTVDEAALVAAPSSVRTPERTLILGWNARVPAIVRGIDAYAIAGSEVLVVSLDAAAAPTLAELAPALEHVRVSHRRDDIADRRVLDQLDPESWNHVMILPPDRIESAIDADARVLIALLHLRDLSESGPTSGSERRAFSVVSEMRDVRSRDLAEVARADDFIISDRLIGLLLAQVAENPDLAAVFADLFDPEGSEIYLRPASDYVVAGREVDMHALIEVGRRRGEVVIGVRIASDALDASQDFGIRVNPRKSTRLRLGAADRVIVLADS
ncbi:CASTOR/POLLUX-related putative ion channel [Nannocystaceae bacterium ST9]